MTPPTITNDQAINEFIKLYRERYGLTLTKEEALTKMSALEAVIRLFLSP